jgi:acetoin utilization deacetylase AcuC-like enzyme
MIRGFGGNLAGGTHHAFRSEGSGFCVFNDLAVAILALRRDGLAARAAVIDLDVHQGDGTASIFEDDSAVLTLSMHGENNFPFRKQRSRIDIALADGTGDAEYLRLLQDVLPEVRAFQSGCSLLSIGRGRSGRRPAGTFGAHAGRLQQRDRLVLKRYTYSVTIAGYAEPMSYGPTPFDGDVTPGPATFQDRRHEL